MNVNFVATEPDSQFYDDLSQLLQTMKYLKMNKTILSARAIKSSAYAMSREEEIDYIIKGVENTIERGYRIHEPVPEGYQRIDVLAGAIVLSPENSPDIPKCGTCNEYLTLVRPGKWQCDHCEF